MNQATHYDKEARTRLGLPALASPEDRHNSLETSGTPTDLYKVEASKDFNVPYEQVTDQMRRASKAAMFYTLYS